MIGASWTSGQARERQASTAASAASGRSASPLAAEIRFNDPLVGLDRAGRPLGDLLAVVQHEHGLAEPHDDLHVVLDEEHGLAPLAQLPPPLPQVLQPPSVDPA